MTDDKMLEVVDRAIASFREHLARIAALPPTQRAVSYFALMNALAKAMVAAPSAPLATPPAPYTGHQVGKPPPALRLVEPPNEASPMSITFPKLTDEQSAQLFQKLGPRPPNGVA